MTSADNTPNSLRNLTARWELPSGGPDEPRRRQLIELAFRLAGVVQPGFAPPRTRQEVSSTSRTDEEMGGYYSTVVYRLGDAERGVEITERVMDPQDGMTPFESSTEIEVYGLPDGWRVGLSGYFTPPLRGPAQEMYLVARLPEAEARLVEGVLKEETGADAKLDA